MHRWHRNGFDLFVHWAVLITVSYANTFSNILQFWYYNRIYLVILVENTTSKAHWNETMIHTKFLWYCNKDNVFYFSRDKSDMEQGNTFWPNVLYL